MNKLYDMRSKLLVICGPTATGKTDLALKLAKKFKGELVSADSRQVYRGMDIGTGKDLPQGAKWRRAKFSMGYYLVEGVKIWGYDLVDPKEEFSVGKYVKIAKKIIEDTRARKRLPVLVGGTGLYIKGIVDGIATSGIPRDESLRKFLEKKKPSELYDQLAQLDPVRAASMNASDRKNPRRLVRAIEIASSRVKSPRPRQAKRGGPKTKVKSLEADVLFVGLTDTRANLNKRIEKQVDERLKRGFERELKNLITNGVNWEHQSMSSLGYRQWTPYSSYLLPRAMSSRRRGESTGQEVRKKVIADWVKEEKKYARRQMIWFVKDKRIKWFNVSNEGWQKRVEKLVGKWYSSK